MRKIIKNLLAGWASSISIGLIGFLMIPFLLGEMGQTSYSLVLFLVAVVGAFQLVDMGVGISLSRELSAARANDQRQEFSELLSSGIAIYAILGLLCSAGIYFGAEALVGAILDETNPSTKAVFICRLYGIGMILIGFLNQALMSVLVSYERFDLSSIVTASTSIGTALLLWLFIPISEDKAFVWAQLQLLSHFSIGFVIFFMGRKEHGPLGISFKAVTIEKCKALLGLSSKVSLLKLTTLFSEKADPLILAKFSTPLSLVLYNSASKVSAATKPFVTKIAEQLCPRATDVFVKGEINEVGKILTVGTRYTMIVGGLFFVMVIVYANPFAQLWLGDALPENWGLVAQLMIGIGVIDYLTFAAGGTQWSVLFGMKKLNFLVISMLPTALLNFGLSVYFVGYTDLGVFGVILATIVISICRRPILIWYTARLVGIRPVTYFLQSYLVPVSLLAAVSLVGHGMIRLWNPVTWTSLIVSAAILTLIWLGLVFQFGVTREERRKVSNWISRVLERFRKHAA